ncbi:MAG: hypothetical protein ACYDA2_05545 [Acidimicrobiales bacterium]
MAVAMPQRHRPELSEAVGGERLVGYRRSARTFPRNRTCAWEGCTTRLSMYNSGRLCAVHAPCAGVIGPDAPQAHLVAS